MSKTKLKPCPFCGGEAKLKTAVGEYWVLCPTCKASSDSISNDETIVKQWNTRVRNKTLGVIIAEKKQELTQLKGYAHKKSHYTHIKRLELQIEKLENKIKGVENESMSDRYNPKSY